VYTCQIIPIRQFPNLFNEELAKWFEHFQYILKNPPLKGYKLILPPTACKMGYWYTLEMLIQNYGAIFLF